MNRRSLGIAFFAMVIGLRLAAQGLEIQQVTEGVFAYATYQPYKGQPVSANGLYIVTDQGVALIDTPWDTNQCKPLLDSIRHRHGVEVRWSISTHSHADRTGSVDILKRLGVATFSTTQTQEICRASGEPIPQFGFSKDTLFHFGQVDVEVFLPGAGHAPDNIVIYLPQKKLLFGGCLVKSTEATGLGYVGDADLQHWPIAIRKLQTRFPHCDYVIPGHQSWKRKRGLQHTLRLLRKHVAQVDK